MTTTERLDQDDITVTTDRVEYVLRGDWRKGVERVLTENRQLSSDLSGRISREQYERTETDKALERRVARIEQALVALNNVAQRWATR